MTRKVEPLIQLEQLEPRIMLSGDSLHNIAPNPDQGSILENTPQAVQFAELLNTNEQIEEQISQEQAPSDTPNTDVYKPIFTLFVDDNNESVDADLSINNVDSAQVNDEIVVLSNDFDGDIESKVGTTEDESPPVYINDAEISIEENTSIEIRGPPLALGEAAMDSSYIIGDLLSTQNGSVILSEGQILYLSSGPSPSELHLDLPTNIDAADTLGLAEKALFCFSLCDQ